MFQPGQLPCNTFCFNFFFFFSVIGDILGVFPVILLFQVRWICSYKKHHEIDKNLLYVHLFHVPIRFLDDNLRSTQIFSNSDVDFKKYRSSVIMVFVAFSIQELWPFTPWKFGIQGCLSFGMCLPLILVIHTSYFHHHNYPQESFFIGIYM